MTRSNEKTTTSEVRPWSEPVAFEAWKHYAGVGGADKDRMVTITTWLLGFSAAIIGFTFTQGIEGYHLKQPLAAGFLATLGLVVSFVAAATALVYGGYANWNWATADQIAKAYDWHYLLPSNYPFESAPFSPHAGTRGYRHRLVGLALKLAKSRPPHEQLAPVFLIFFWVAVLSLLIHLAVLIWSIVVAPPRSATWLNAGCEMKGEVHCFLQGDNHATSGPSRPYKGRLQYHAWR